MKVNNKQFIRKLTVILIIISIPIGSLCLISLLRPNLFSSTIIFLLFTLFFCPGFIYTQLRYIEFDSTGEVLVLKKYHPLKSGKHLHTIRAVELPKHMIKNHSINKGFLYKELILLIENENNKLINLKFNLSQMEMRTIKNIHLELNKQSK